MSFLGLIFPETTDLGTRWKNATVDTEVARKNIAPIQCPIFIITGTADPLIPITKPLYDLLVEGGKTVQMDIYEHGYHDFCIGPQGYPGSHQPLLEGTLASLERALEFFRETP
jgi:acetyl esterase/lipase